MSFALAQNGPSRSKDLWRLLAFLGRYCHQNIVTLRDQFTVNELVKMRDATVELLEAEKPEQTELY